ncbi:MAG: hypothetical protein LBP59_00070 [Planctomycetaceae bacterium]|jgi:hypothetical protein|nr:hypothetical protein [Planctomycetaceae bacterium]
MTFPIPPLNPETESLEMAALSPSSKVFVAATIIFIGSVVAMIHAQIPVASLANLPNEVIDQNLVVAPLPDTHNIADNGGDLNANNELRVALAELNRDELAPMMAAGSAKYTQAYPQPAIDSQIIPQNVQQTSAANITEPKPLITPTQNSTDDKQQNSNEQLNNQKNKSFDFKPLQTTPNTSKIFGSDDNKIDRKTLKPTPTITPPTEIADSMLPLLQFAENLKSTKQSESDPLIPVDVFQNSDMAPIYPANPTLVPLAQAKN